MMKKLITQIFHEMNFTITSIPSIDTIDSFFAISNDEDKINYYLVLFVEDLSTIKKDSNNLNRYFENIKRLEESYDNKMDKNLSMVICAKRNHMQPDDEINKTIFKIEEDPYFFKKYVLTYTDIQIQKLSDYIPENSSIIESLNGILHSESLFQEFKLNTYEQTEYNLVSRLFIKLPFLNLKSFKREMNDLSLEIDSLLREKNLLDLKEIALTSSITHEDNDIRSNVLKFIGVEKNE